MAYYRAKPSRSGLDYQERRQIEARKKREEDIEALCVVGYASKLFKDDATAMEIHRGKYLVPWMGDNNLMIDRFDGRGHLSDLSEFDRVHSWSQVHQYSGEEARIEAICDEERYLALRADLMEEETRREEERKRLQQSMGALGGQSYYGAVAPAYGAGSSQKSEEYDPTMPTEDDAERAERLAKGRAPTPELEQPFIAPKSLKLPSGIETPATQKLNTIIERTAAFIASQNPQMEIVIKAKQANNPQFDFLNYDHYLNPYYRHIVKLIKEGRYVPAPPEEKAKPAEDSDSDDDGYLHPGLLGGSEPEKPRPAARAPVKPVAAALPTTTITPIPNQQSQYIPGLSINDPPSQPTAKVPPSSTAPGVSKVPSFLSQPASVAPPVVQPVPGAPPPAVIQPTSSVQQTGPMPPVSMPQASLPPVSMPQVSVPHVVVPPVVVPPVSGAPTGDTETLAAYYANAASELVNAYLSALATSAPPPPPGSQDVSQKPPEEPITTTETTIPGLGPDRPVADPPKEAIPDLEPALPIIPPPPDIQPIVDKLAQFVAKNGDDFESGVRLKGDSRFDFITPGHSFYGYYRRKKLLFKEEIAVKEAAELEAQKAPVSFSIKPRDVKKEEKKIGQSALPMEESDSDEELPVAPRPPSGTLDQSAGMNELINLTKQQIALAMAASMAGGPKTEAASPAPPKFDPTSRPKIAGLFGEAEKPKAATMDRPRWNETGLTTTGVIPTPVAVTAMEAIGAEGKVSVDYNHGRPRPTPAPPSVPPPPRSRDFSHLTERAGAGVGTGPGRPLTYEERVLVRPPVKPAVVSREELARRQAEKAKLEDKLAKAARAKMTGISKERQLQLERRKKAALFMSRMKDGGDSYLESESSGRRDRDSGRRGSSREKKRSRDRSPLPKVTPKAYQTSSRSRRRSRSPTAKRSSPSLSSRPRTEAAPAKTALTPILKKSTTRESSPSDNGAVKGILKKDFQPGTLGGILKKTTIEERKARIKKLVESSKKTPSGDSNDVIEVD